MRSRSVLATGAALCVLGLQSAAHAGVPPTLGFTMVDAMSATFAGNDAATTTSYGFAGPSTNFLNDNNYSGPFNAFLMVGAYGVGYDILATRLFTGSLAGLDGGLIGSATVSWTVTFTTNTLVYGFYDTLGGTWTVNSNLVSMGDFFAAGTYTFLWTLDAATPVEYENMYVLMIGFMDAGPGGVPLPGAAGLAAVGLVGLARRRRR